MFEFDDAWRARYGDTPPIGWRLRERFGGDPPTRWLRIHGLPALKQYPETAEELAEIHRRHELIAAELFAWDDGACWVVVPEWKENAGASHRLKELPDLEFAIGWRAREREDDDPLAAWVAPACFSAAGTRAARELVIGHRSLRILWVARETMEVFAPYNGGVDIIAADTARRDDLARRFSAWRSPRRDGL